MNERNGSTGDQVEQAIEAGIARRAVGGSAGTLPGNLLSTDEALVAELAALTAVEWPADETGDRIASAVTAGQLASGSAGPELAAAPDRRGRRGPRQQRPVRSRWLVAAAAAVAAALAGGTAQFLGAWPDAAGPVVGSSAAGGANSAPNRPGWLTAMTIVSKPGALRAIGVVPTGNAFLTCVSRTVCYVDGARRRTRFVARSADGGATWTVGAALPTVPGREWNATLSCQTPLRCVSAYASGMVETSDGFAHARFRRITTPGDIVYWATCPTTHDCVAAVTVGPANDKGFVYSRDGGRSWTAATAPPVKPDWVVVQMRCDASGACIAALSGGDDENATVAALSSTNGGRSWKMSATYSVGAEEQYWGSCGDARDCVVGGNFGGVPLAWIHVTASGEISIRVQQLPLQVAGTGISCATARICFLVAGDTIDATQDGGHSWTAAPTAPAAQGGGAALVDISCPVPAGCTGLARLNGIGWAVVSELRHGR